MESVSNNGRKSFVKNGVVLVLEAVAAGPLGVGFMKNGALLTITTEFAIHTI